MPFDGVTRGGVSRTTQELIDARHRIDKGWIQGQMKHRCVTWRGEVKISYCMLGAGGDPVLLLRAIHDLGYEYENVTDFNDAIARTKMEVLAVYDWAVELSRGAAEANEA